MQYAWSELEVLFFVQKNDFYSVKIEQDFAIESWFDVKNSPISYIVA